MTTYKPLNILVGIDLSDMDQFLIQYLQNLNHILDIEKVTFLHNIKLGELPKELISDESLERIQGRIIEKVSNQIKNKNAQYEFEVKISIENYSEIAFVNLTKSQTFDMLILGNKQKFRGNGALAHKLVKILPCATLLVPETYRSPVKTVIDAVDFSKYTPAIMEWAARFKNNSKNQEIEHWAVHISKFYWGLSPAFTSKDIDKFTDHDRIEKQKKWDKEYASYSELEIISAREKSIPTTLINYAENKKADLMILGVKGTSALKELFMGGVAHHIFERPTNTCLLFVKSKR